MTLKSSDARARMRARMQGAKRVTLRYHGQHTAELRRRARVAR